MFDNIFKRNHRHLKKFRYILNIFHYTIKKFQHIIYKILFNKEEAALHLACEIGNLKIVKLLIVHKNLDINLIKEIFSYCQTIALYFYYLSSYSKQVLSYLYNT